MINHASTNRKIIEQKICLLKTQTVFIFISKKRPQLQLTEKNAWEIHHSANLNLFLLLLTVVRTQLNTRYLVFFYVYLCTEGKIVNKTKTFCRVVLFGKQNLRNISLKLQIHKIIGFAPTLLQVIMSQEFDMPVKQSGVVYLKNMVNGSWEDKETETGKPIPFSIHEQDRAMIRDAIIDAIVHSPELIRNVLAVILNHIIKNDFPGRWTGIVDKINVFLQSSDPQIISGALLCFHSLVKVYE